MNSFLTMRWIWAYYKVWLNREQLAKLFDRDVKTIGKHINNALNEELQDVPTVAKFATVQKDGNKRIAATLVQLKYKVKK